MWQNGADLNTSRATSGTFDPLGYQAQEGGRTVSGNSLDSTPDLIGNHRENAAGGANIGHHQGNREDRPGNGEEVQKQREKTRLVLRVLLGVYSEGNSSASSYF